MEDKRFSAENCKRMNEISQSIQLHLNEIKLHQRAIDKLRAEKSKLMSGGVHNI